MYHLANSYYSNYKPTRAALKKHGIHKKLINNKDIVILRPDKRNGVVIMDKITYKSKMDELLNDESKFKQLTSDPTKLREGQLQRYFRKLNNKGYFDESIYDYVYPAGFLPSRLYGTPKIHKINEKSDITPLRPIVSSINSYNYNLASYLCALLIPFIRTAYYTKDSFTFIKDIQEVSTQDSFMVSYDVCSLFTNIPLSEAIDIAVKLILENKKDLKFSENELTKLFRFVMTQTHFYFDGKIFDQVDRVAMGSPLGPDLANLFMGYYEQKWSESDHGRLVEFYRRYVDDTFCLFENEHQAQTFLDFLNIQHQNLNFTIEKEHMKQLPFLDILNTRSDRLITSVYRKSTFTGLLQNYNSFVQFTYEKGLLKSLTDRTFCLNNTRVGFHLDLEKLKVILQKNEYPPKLIDKSVYRYLSKKISNKPSETDPIKTNENIRYFKLPFIGKFSKFTENKLQKLTKKFCKEGTNIKIVFSIFKLASLFSTKDKVPYGLKSYVIYKFLCAGCNASYVGETYRHIYTRTHEHLETDLSSNIYRHLLKNPQCKSICDENCFSILDSVRTKYTLKLKEGMYIKWLKSSIYKQVKRILPSILV